MVEQWKSVPGYGNLLEASNNKNIRVKDRLVEGKTRSGSVCYHTKPSVVLAQHKTQGYKAIRVNIDRERKTIKAHILIALAWNPNPKNLPVVRHFDNNKENNMPDNLIWSTVAENNQQAIDDGLRNFIKGDKCSWTKATTKIIEQVKNLYHTKTQKELADIFSLGQSTISRIINNQRAA